MPFRGLLDGEIVVPATVPDNEEVTCPGCGDTMYPRDADGRARHFYHVNGRGSCPAESEGESSTHARCVALAVAALQDQFADQAARCGAEIDVDVAKSGSPKRIRRADALVEFEAENPYFGQGIVIEVQHRHDDKDVETTTHDYLSVGCSVAWLPTEAFGEEALDYAIVDENFAHSEGSGFSVRKYSPKRFIDCEHYHYEGEHNWGTVPSYILDVEEEYEICTSRPCSLRRQYDQEAGEYVYDPDSLSPPDLPLRVLRDTIVRRTPGRDIEGWLPEVYRDAVLEKALTQRPEIDECPGPKGFHEWGEGEPYWGGQRKVQLRPCQHCSVHLFTDLRGYPDDRTDVFFSERPDPEWDLPSLEADPRQCEHKSYEAGSWHGSCPVCGVAEPN